jgi:UDP-glucose 6-dehydrogenase
VSNKKRVKFSKYQVFKHTTESKKKNMVGSNPEILKRKAITDALNPTYISTSTGSDESVLQYTLVPGKSNGE